ncbi:MAG: ribonuclease G [Bdellovibrionaceae bacterium]|nr:ribonuclease G [Pseudobdellovibrionaceae bacterium]|tara:strand:+ start:2145 stop:4904 length:2760 start_codon:yes stop_codon:yes gene_type:complete
MARELIINASLPETRIALIEDGEIQELQVERASDRGIVGNIYKGRVTRVLPGMQAAFVDIGLEKAAFLYVDDVFHYDKDKKANTELSQDEDREDSDLDEEVEAEALAEAIEHVEELRDTESVDNDGEEDEDFEEEDSENSSEDDYEDEEDTLEEEETLDSDESDEEDSQAMATDDEPEAVEGTLAPPAQESTQEIQVSSVEKESNEEPSLSDEQKTEQGEHSVEDSSQDVQVQSTSESNQKKKNNRRPRQNRNKNQDRKKKNYHGLPESYHEEVAQAGDSASDREAMSSMVGEETQSPAGSTVRSLDSTGDKIRKRSEFRERRGRDKKIRSRPSNRPRKSRVSIDEILKEGQEVIVQVAKDPIAAKGARLTCHVSLAGRHLVCMPTIDHVGVSRRIEKDEERRRFRNFVEDNRPENYGFIVRTASGGKDAETWLKKDMEYLDQLWKQIKKKADETSAPALIHEDMNTVLRSIRDWVNEDISKIIVDSKYYYNDIKSFVSRFMPKIEDRVELYQGDIPIFDAYGISTELHRALERKVWLKSGGYIVVDQAEALVAIDVNTGRFVGKKNLEDTILKTNLEAVEEIAYQLRLRNCGGIIIIDLIDMEKDENKRRVYRTLEDALAKDRARPTILKISELGLIEMTRKRTRDTMVRTMCEPCRHCESRGYVKSRKTVAYEVLREIERTGIEREIKKILVQCHPDVIEILATEEREVIDHLEKRYRKQIYLQAVGDFHDEQFEVSGDASLKPIQTTRPARNHQRNNNKKRSQQKNHKKTSDRNRRPSEDSKQETDSDSIGNQVSSSGNSDSSSGVENEVNGNIAAPVKEANEPKNWSPSNDDFESEEDRLAFLRAQAAQDAALANYGEGTPPMSPSANNNRNGRNRNPGNRGRNQRRNNNQRGRRKPTQRRNNPEGNGSTPTSRD